MDFEAIERQIRWDPDPAASGPRWRAFVLGVELCVYETGDWRIYRAYRPIASGVEKSLERGQKRCLRVLRALVDDLP